MSVRDDLAERVGVDLEAIDPLRVALYATLVGLVVFYLSPLESGLMTALKTEAEFATSPPFVPPTVEGFTLEPFGVAIDTLSSAILNSIMLAVPATVLSALFGSFAAYGLTNFEWRGQLGVVALFIAGIFIPYQAVLIPLSRLWAIVDTQELLAPLLDITVFSAQVPVLGTVELATHPHYASIINLIITHTAYGIPITTLLFRGYYKKLSTEMLEAARLDGAGAFTVYRRIVLPLSMPMFAVTLIYQFTQVWNDLLFALIIIPSGSGPAAVATIALNELTGGIIQTFNTQMAGAFVAALPTLLVYVLFGDKFAKGVAGGT
ncbi:carbohydrate ABC transporter permease [Haloferax sp. Atlit-10N]|uniref:carbohydrate ABC transporter permease n=1 Tax=Haloferax TaxID=2251 RepID=UPI0006780E1E|nr:MULTISPECIES: carbohydrate ABC transporter permease [Haloferax]RDZ44029.1 carbohydrate ABC transporter permease [Haloferax sp. Atlit-16N]RDZ47517.1 carbohydrate ABC transporter permease [Haloferax sp. Atlit-19N]RDZ58073.1 carbohydrate ABC transporter permease [Haloferax sp. Atlit-10N]